MILGRGLEIELEEDPIGLAFDGLGVEAEGVGDPLVRAAIGHQLEHLAVA